MIWNMYVLSNDYRNPIVIIWPCTPISATLTFLLLLKHVCQAWPHLLVFDFFSLQISRGLILQSIQVSISQRETPEQPIQNSSFLLPTNLYVFILLHLSNTDHSLVFYDMAYLFIVNAPCYNMGIMRMATLVCSLKSSQKLKLYYLNGEVGKFEGTLFK